MKKAIKFLLVSLAVTSLLTACAEPPATSLNDAKSALEAVVKAGGDDFSPEIMQSINRRYQEGLDEVKLQEASAFGNYGMAQFTLDQVTDDCNALLAKIAAQKGEVVATYVRKSQPFVAE